MKNQKIRSMKVHEQSGYNYKATPTIILKGQWLKEMGFEIGDYITVSCEEGKLIITPDAEKAAMAKAEAEFMEKGMKKLESEGRGYLNLYSPYAPRPAPPFLYKIAKWKRGVS